ncbi:unnamed protein product [Cochlearia groenlandica]
MLWTGETPTSSKPLKETMESYASTPGKVSYCIAMEAPFWCRTYIFFTKTIFFGANSRFKLQDTDEPGACFLSPTGLK